MSSQTVGSQMSSRLMVLLFSFLFLTTACTGGLTGGGEKDSNNSANSTPRHDRPIPLPEVTAEGCLNLQAYYGSLNAMFPGTMARVLTTDFTTSPMQDHTGISREFLLHNSAGNFEIEDKPVSEIPQFAPVEQTKCETVVFKSPGHENSYKITSFTSDSLVFENEWNGETTVKWLSPTSLSLTETSFIGHFLCDEKSMVKSHSTKLINWAADAQSPTLAVDTINADYLSRVAEATSFPLESAYTTVEIRSEPDQPAPETPEVPMPGNPDFPGGNPVTAERKLLVSKLLEMRMTPVRTELAQCHP